MRTRRRVDDRTAIVDWMFAHGALLAALVVLALGLAIPAMRGAVRGAAVVGAVAAGRLLFHPLRFVWLSRVWIENERIFVGSPFGRAREVAVARIEHDAHSPWPCVLHLTSGESVRFVARRDDGFGALFDLEPSDRARYERPRDARDSLTDLELTARRS